VFILLYFHKMKMLTLVIKIIVLSTLLSVLIPSFSNAETTKEINSSAEGKLVSVSGYITDSKTGESLIGATIYIRELKKGIATNQYGFYSISVLPGTYNFDFSYVGYQTISKALILTDKSNVLNFELIDEAQQIGEVVVKSENASDKIKKAEMSVTKLEMKTIKKIPALMGEIDVIKVIQMLPGVVATSEGSSGFSVRGGSADQNLILLDEATVYNASHLMGFFSIFNNDAVKDVKLYKGDIPAAYGGRLSSLLDVRLKDGNSKQLSVSGGLGLLSSRLTVEGPIINEHTSFIVSGRRTYYDIFFPLFKRQSAELANSTLYFYDLNAKINHQFNSNNRLFLSGYFGNDVFDYNEQFGFNFGNKTGTLRWNHQYNPQLFSNLSFIVSKYNYQLGASASDTTSFKWDSYLSDYSLKLDYSIFPNASNTIKFGVSSTYHIINPAYVTGRGVPEPFSIPNNYALEHGVYISNEQEVTDKLNVKYGIRMSVFQNIGKATVYKYNSKYESIDSTVYGNNNIFKTQFGWEPRLGLAYQLTEASSIKASYSRTLQFMQLASNSTGGLPLDIWFFSSPNVKPQVADQVALGYFHNFYNNAFETSIELFYKKMDDIIDFKDNASLLFNKKLEGEVRTGTGYSMGAEFMIQYNIEKFNGWVSYTISKTERQVDAINNGNWYRAPFDKTQSFNFIFTYELNTRVSLSSNWVYATGAPVTFPSFRWEFGGIIQKGYTNRNTYRLQAYHRLDLAVTIKQRDKKFNFIGKQRIWQGEWVIGVYNVYNRKNAWIVNFVDDPEKPGAKYAEKISILSILPSITYNFKF
jgi:hypothetical protein